jgi:hypothetical protein
VIEEAEAKDGELDELRKKQRQVGACPGGLTGPSGLLGTAAQWAPLLVLRADAAAAFQLLYTCYTSPTPCCP